MVLSKIIERGRADSWKELMNAYTSDYYHEQILSVNIAQLDAQQQSNQTAMEMEDLLRTSTELQAYQTIVDFAALGNSIYQNDILEKHHREMTRIRRSTKKRRVQQVFRYTASSLKGSIKVMMNEIVMNNDWVAGRYHGADRKDHKQINAADENYSCI